MFGATHFDSSANSRFVREGRNSERNEATLDIGMSVRKTFVVGKTTAAAFLDVFNLLNANDLRIFTYDPSKANLTPRDSIPAGVDPGESSVPGRVTVPVLERKVRSADDAAIIYNVRDEAGV